MSRGRVALNTLAGVLLGLLVAVVVVLILGGTRGVLEGAGLGWIFTLGSFGFLGYLLLRRIRRR